MVFPHVPQTILVMQSRVSLAWNVQMLTQVTLAKNVHRFLTAMELTACATKVKVSKDYSLSSFYRPRKKQLHFGIFHVLFRGCEERG
jgi:hypothetical protein